MKPTEAAALLTIAAAYDNRKPDADTAKAWALALDGLRFADCRDVIVRHYQRSREWLMPSDVIAGVRRLRDKRLADHPPVDPPAWIDPDNARALIEWQRETDLAIADGTYVDPPRPEIVYTDRPVAELGHVGSSVREGLATAKRDKQAADAEKTAARAAKAAERTTRPTPTPPADERPAHA